MNTIRMEEEMLDEENVRHGAGPTSHARDVAFLARLEQLRGQVDFDERPESQQQAIYWAKLAFGIWVKLDEEPPSDQPGEYPSQVAVEMVECKHLCVMSRRRLREVMLLESDYLAGIYRSISLDEATIKE